MVILAEAAPDCSSSWEEDQAAVVCPGPRSETSCAGVPLAHLGCSCVPLAHLGCSCGHQLQPGLHLPPSPPVPVCTEGERKETESDLDLASSSVIQHQPESKAGKYCYPEKWTASVALELLFFCLAGPLWILKKLIVIQIKNCDQCYVPA